MNDFHTLYSAGRVGRYHTVDVPGQSVAEHSWGVAMVVRRVMPPTLPQSMMYTLLCAALEHDLSESELGDIPATAKWSDKNLAKLIERREAKFDERYGLVASSLEGAPKRLLRWADTFELCLYCLHLSKLGNLYAEEILGRGLMHLTQEIGFPSTEAKELYDQIFG